MLMFFLFVRKLLWLEKNIRQYLLEIFDLQHSICLFFIMSQLFVSYLQKKHTHQLWSLKSLTNIDSIGKFSQLHERTLIYLQIKSPIFFHSDWPFRRYMDKHVFQDNTHLLASRELWVILRTDPPFIWEKMTTVSCFMGAIYPPRQIEYV